MIPSGTDKELLSNCTKRNAHKSKDLVKVYKIRQLDVFCLFVCFCLQNNGMIDWLTHLKLTNWLTDGRTDGMTDCRKNGRTDGLTDGRTEERTHERTDWLADRLPKWPIKWVLRNWLDWLTFPLNNKWLIGLIDGTDGRMDGRTDRLIDRRAHGRTDCLPDSLNGY